MLNTVFSKEKTQSIIDVMPDEMIVWKVVACPANRKKTPFRDMWHSAYNHHVNGGNTVYHKGQKAQNLPNGALSEQPGYHSFAKKESAEKYRSNFCYNDVVVSAVVKVTDITVMGNEVFCEVQCGLCVVTDYIIMPTYPNTDITKELDSAPLIEDCVEAMELMQV